MRMVAPTCFLAVVSILLSGNLQAAEVAKQVTSRVWTDSTGKFKIEAELVEILDDKVRLKKKDGQELTVPVNRLSVADQTFVLANQLAARGDAVDAENRQYVYWLAARYAPDDAEIAKKYAEAPKGINLNEAEIALVASLIGKLYAKECMPWPRSRSKEAVELKILLDRELTGEFRCTNFSAENDSLFIILHEPNRTVDEVIKMYGRPSRKAKHTLFYGDVGLATDGKKIVAVLFPPPEDPAKKGRRRRGRR